LAQNLVSASEGISDITKGVADKTLVRVALETESPKIFKLW